MEYDTAVELSRNLEYILPHERLAVLSKKEVSESYSTADAKSEKASRLTYNKQDRKLNLFLLDPVTQEPAAGLVISLLREPEPNDLKFCKDYLRVFNSDLATAPDVPSSNELWIALQQTRFARAIGRFSPFPTEKFMHWLRVVENAGSLRYEGHPFSACILMTKQMKWVENSESLRLLKFPDPLRFRLAILQEKWIRAMLRDPEVGLVGLSSAGSIVGTVTFEEALGQGMAFAPHEEMMPISLATIPGTMAFVSSTHGDLYVLFPNGATFIKTQGRWRYFNYSSLNDLVAQLLPKEVVPGLIRIVLDLSFERRGGLISILNDANALKKLVPDHETKGRVNQPLRSFAAGLEISDKAHRRVIRSAAAIDGAIVLSQDGKVLDIACMIGEPSAEDCLAAGKSGLQRFAGARTTAAWNASIYGVAIKISEDGPVTVFKNGDVIFQFG
jgi:hypothetical protein